MIIRVVFHNPGATVSYYLVVAKPGVQKGGEISLAELCGGGLECLACGFVMARMGELGLDYLSDEAAKRFGFEGRRFNDPVRASQLIRESGFTFGSLITPALRPGGSA